MNKKNVFIATGILFIGMFSYSPLVLATGQETTAVVEFKAGALTVSAPDNVEMKPYTIDRLLRKTGETSPSVIEVKDYRGSSSEGWTLYAIASVPENTDIIVALSPKLLSNNTVATTIGTYQSILTSRRAVSINNENIAAAEQVTQFNPTIEFWIPATIKVGTYTATITWDLVTSPTV
ncbi:hypothetical protein [Enterococcus faecalis]|uniref:hypothetical protein n=1 Tax=Enterococcus faecalis TaxID=1351 RepID=UPI002FBD3C49